MDLAPLRASLAADIATATSLPVATDPKKAHAPCVLVGPITDVASVGLCAWQLEIQVWVIAPAPGDAVAVDLLARHVTDVLGACGDATATLSTTNVGQGDLPAYEVTAILTAKE